MQKLKESVRNKKLLLPLLRLSAFVLNKSKLKLKESVSKKKPLKQRPNAFVLKKNLPLLKPRESVKKKKLLPPLLKLNALDLKRKLQK